MLGLSRANIVHHIHKKPFPRSPKKSLPDFGQRETLFRHAESTAKKIFRGTILFTAYATAITVVAAYIFNSKSE